MFRQLILFLIIFGSICSNATAQQLYYQNLNTEKGLPTDLVFDLANDKNGLIYLGTQYGLYSFNGIEFKNIPFVKHKSNSITSIVFTDNNNLWCRNFSEQIFYYKNDTMFNFNKIDKLLKGDIIIDIKTLGNKIYVAAFNNIYEIDDFTHEILLYCNLKNIETFEVFQNNLLVIDINGNIYQVNKNKVIKIAELPFAVSRMCVVNNTAYFIQKGNSTGEIFQLYNGVLRSFASVDFTSQTQVNNLVSVENKIAVSSNRGMYVLDVKTKKYFNINDKYRTSDIIIDRETNFWTSTLDNGLIKIPSFSVEYIFPKNNNEIYTHITSFNKHYLLASNKGNVYSIDSTGRLKDTFISNTGKEIDFIYFNKTSDKIYTSIGDFDVKTKKFNLFYYGKNISFDTSNNLYFALHSIAGVLTKNKTNPIFNFNELQKFTIDNSEFYEIRKQRSRSVLSVNDTILYVAYSDNLYYYTPTIKKVIIDKDSISIYGIDIKKGSNDNIWIGTTQNGVYLINKSDVKKHYSIINGLSGNTCRRIFIDNNSVYVLTENGLDKINATNDSVFSITKAYGINNLTFYDFYVSNTKIYLLSNEGVLSIPKNYENAFINPSLFFTKTLYDGNIDIKPNEKISYNNNSLQFNFQLLSYIRSKNTILKYRLIGLDSNWNQIAPQINFLKFNNLPHGDYNLQLLAENKIKVEFPFSISKPFWLTWWFIFIEIIFGLLLIYLTIQITQFRLRKKQIFKEKLILSQLTALRSQMNPHFLYNVLNSLQGLIYSKKINEAGTYVSKFSDHLRYTLNMSDKQQVTIKEEIESLNIYLELEKLRFGDDFIYQLIKNSDVNDYSKIPALIVQPFVENAVKYGLLNKKGDKKLFLLFENINNNIKVTIQDNGIGRAASYKINEKRKDKPSSFATIAIYSRIELINRQRKQEIKIDITDLYDNNIACGTKVELYIPI